MTINNVIIFTTYANGSAELKKVLSFEDRENAKKYVNEIIEDEKDNLVDWEEDLYVIYEDYGETTYVEIAESEVE